MKPQRGSQRLPKASPLSAKPAKSRLQPELAAPRYGSMVSVWQ